MENESVNAVQIILGNQTAHRTREKLLRLHFLSQFYIVVVLVLSAIAIFLGICFLSTSQPRVGVPLLIAAAAFLTYGFNAQLQRQLRVGAYTSGVLAMLRGRWDELRNDSTLVAIFSGGKESLTNEEELKLRYYLYTLFDVYDYATHLIYYGYFSYPEALANQYENMIRKLLLSPHVVTVWESRDETGELFFQNEYSPHLRKVVSIIVSELRSQGRLAPTTHS